MRSLLSKTIALVTAALVLLVAYHGTALAATAADDPGSLYDLVKPVLNALVHGQYALGAALALVVAVALARRHAAKVPVIGPKVAAFLATEPGALLLVFLGSVGGAFATAVTAGAMPSLALAWTAVKVAAGAAGGYKALRVLLVPLVERLSAKSPAWSHWAFDLVLYLFGRSTAIAKAEVAGAVAVEAAPAGGVDAVVGKAEEF